MIEAMKTKRTMVILAVIAAIGLGGAEVAVATGLVPGDKSEKEDSLKGPEADRASAAAEIATGGKATDVERADTSAEQNGTGTVEKDEVQPPANVVYEVEVDKSGKEIDVYLDKSFQVIATRVDN